MASPRETAAWDPYEKYRFVGGAFAAIIIGACIYELIANALSPTARDFISFWGAGRLALARQAAAAYDNAVLHAVQEAVASFGGTAAQMPFPYPPAYLALVTPFALPPFPAGMALWVAATFAFYMFAARRLVPGAGWLPAAFPAVYACAAIGQNAFLTAGIFMLGLSLMARRPFAAGLVLGCLVVKPQIALLLPVAVLAAGRWATVAGAIISAVGVIAGGVLLFGWTVTSAWIEQLPLYATITRDGLVGWSKLSSVYASARAAGLDVGIALGLHAIVAIAAAACVWLVWRAPAADRFGRVAVLSAATALASPYFFFYDSVLLAPAFLYLAARGERPLPILLLWAMPLLQMAQIATVGIAINFNLVAAVALLVLVVRRWRFQQAGSTAAEAPPL